MLSSEIQKIEIWNLKVWKNKSMQKSAKIFIPFSFPFLCSSLHSSFSFSLLSPSLPSLHLFLPYLFEKLSAWVPVKLYGRRTTAQGQVWETEWFEDSVWSSAEALIVNLSLQQNIAPSSQCAEYNFSWISHRWTRED